MEQKSIINRFIDTSRFVYNKTLKCINDGHRVNFQDLRDLLVTENTKKDYDEYKTFDADIDLLRQQKKSLPRKKHIDEQIKAIQQQRRNLMKEFDYKKNDTILEFEKDTPKDVAMHSLQVFQIFETGTSSSLRWSSKERKKCTRALK